MKNTIRIVLFAWVLVLIPSVRAYADMYGPFPGFPALEKEAENIIVASIVDTSSSTCLTFSCSLREFGIRAQVVFKGDLHAGSTTQALLSNYPIFDEKHENIGIQCQGFEKGDTYLLFLEKNLKPDGSYGYSTVRGRKYDELISLGSAGSCLPISKATNIDRLKGKTVQEAITTIFGDIVNANKRYVENYESFTQELLHQK